MKNTSSAAVSKGINTRSLQFTEPKHVVILGWTDTEWVIMYNKDGWGTDGIGRVRFEVGFVQLTLWSAIAEWRGTKGGGIT